MLGRNTGLLITFLDRLVFPPEWRLLVLAKRHQGAPETLYTKNQRRKTGHLPTLSLEGGQGMSVAKLILSPGLQTWF